MMNKLILALGLTCFSLSLFASTPSSLVGTWESDYCSPYNDNISNGTYNFVFSANSEVESYIQYYNDMHCSARLRRSSPQVKGNYRVTKYSNKNSIEKYSLSVRYRHMSKPLEYEAFITGDSMRLCKKGHCSNYVRRNN